MDKGVVKDIEFEINTALSIIEEFFGSPTEMVDEMTSETTLGSKLALKAVDVKMQDRKVVLQETLRWMLKNDLD